jgi:hypothetical protein
MSILSKIKRGGESLPPRIILSGPEGIGKSTFAASAPDALFLALEDGLTGIDHVARIRPAGFSEVMAVCDELLATESEYKTLVIDTVDALERSIHLFVCDRDQKTGIEDYGYSKGYKVAEQELSLLLAKLEALREKRKITVILLSHVHIKAFTSPDGTTWDRYEMKGHKGFTGILREWPEACLFAVYEVFKMKEKGEQREKTVAGERIIHTQWSPGWDAKNRLGLPETLALSWEDFSAQVSANSPARLREQFTALLKTAELPPDDKAKWAKTDVITLPVDRIKNGIVKLQKLQPSTK